MTLPAGLALALVRPEWTRTAALGTQTLALLGTLVGIFTIVVGVGPRSIPDVVYQVAIVTLLAWGLALARRARPSDAGVPA